MAGPSPACLVQDAGGAYVSTSGGVDVGAGDTIGIKLASGAGVRTWSLAIVGYDELTALSVPTLQFNAGPPQGYTFTYPATAGKAIIFQSTITDNQVPPVTYQTTFGIYSRTGGNRVIALSETFESNVKVGWIASINRCIRLLPSGVAGGANALPADAISLSLPSAGTAVNIPVAHAFTSNQNVTVAAAGASVSPTIAGILSIRARVCITAPAGPTDVAFAIYQNGVQVADSVSPVKVAAAELTTAYLETLVTAAVNDTFQVQAFSVGAAGATTLAVSNASIVLDTPSGPPGAIGPQGPPGSGGGGLSPPGPPLTGSVNSIPSGNTSNCVDCTSGPVGLQLSNGASDGESKSFYVIGGNGTYDVTLTPITSSITSASNGGQSRPSFKATGIAGNTITITWVAAASSGAGAWFTA